MAPPSIGRSPLRPALTLIGLVALALGTVEVLLTLDVPDGYPVQTALSSVVGWVYVAAGLLAWSRRPSNRLGLLMVVGGFALLVPNLVNGPDAVLVAIGTATGTTVYAVVVHLLHAFPSGRLPTTASTAVVVAGYLVCLVLQAPLYLFTAQAPPYDLLVVGDRPDLARAGSVVQTVAGLGVLVTTAVMLAGRLRRATPTQRRVLAPLYAFGILVLPLIPLLASVIGPLTGLPPDTVIVLQLIGIAGIPVAFARGVLRGGFARTGDIEELSAWLGTSGGSRPELGTALARTLGDDSLRLVFWVPDRGRYVDAAGRGVEMPAAGSGRAAVEVELAGHRIGAIVYDASLIADPVDIRVAGQVAAIAVDRERLTAELLASKEALRHSRARIVEAGDRERRRIAQNLHDGLQVRLVLLAMEAQLVAKDDGATAATRQAATALRVGIDEAAAELRTLVHAVMPAALIQRGLSAATEDLVDRVAVPTSLELGVADGVLSPAVESTAYFVVAEALANALKHSGATELAVRLALDDGHLHVEVRDDGAGGAVPEAGTGLRGLVDRVDAVGGTLLIDSPVGSGTRITADLPCE